MYYQTLAVDYDGTVAADGVVQPATLAALRRFRESGRRLVLVTGRIIEQLVQVFPEMEMCDLVVSDNGAVLYEPHSGHKKYLAEPPKREFILELERRGVRPIEVGDVIVATWEPYETVALQVIRDMGLELQIIFNKGAVMILPTGVNKATGLKAALKLLEISPAHTIGMGDAENDEAFLKMCGVSVAVENALEVVKKQVDLVTRGARGDGVIEVINQVLKDDLASIRAKKAQVSVTAADLRETSGAVEVQ